MTNPAVHYDPDVLTVGTPRTRVQAVFGDPNASRTATSGQTEDIYAFYPDGTKFVDPEVRPRNVALAIFTMGTSTAVRQARLYMAQKKLTLYHVVYSANGTIQSVQVEKMSEAPAGGPAVQQSPAKPAAQ
jgi:hypothetical protein